MAYPNFKNKHLEKALFSPKNFISWKKYKEKDRKKPKRYILVYYPYLVNYFRRKYNTKKIKLYRLITIYYSKNIGVVLMTGIGSPNAAVVMEELIALGGKEFINMGACGGLNNFGVFLCNKAIRDEGTSHHYLPNNKYVEPDKNLTKRLEKSMKKYKIDFENGVSWTIDAPYRETISEIKYYKKQGIKTVEMEASALFSVAKIRKVKIASAFVVTDILGEDKWNPQFNSRKIKEKLRILFDASLDCLKN